SSFQVTPPRPCDRVRLLLPEGRLFLHLVTGDSPREKNGVILGSLDSKDSRRVLADESSVALVPPVSGSRLAHLLFIRENTLMAQPFDLQTLQPAGDLFPAAEQVSLRANFNFALLSVSDNGILAYQAGGALQHSQLAWFDRGGKQLGLAGAPGAITNFALSPDEKTIAISRADARGKTSDIWLHEIARGTETRLTFHASHNDAPVWSPHGDRIVFASTRSRHYDIYQKATNGAGQDEPFLENPNRKGPYQWSRDGRFVIYGEVDAKTKFDVWFLENPAAPAADRKPVPFLKTEFNEVQGQLSPDGRWMAYASDESGRREVYVRPFPAADGQWRISTAGGDQPRLRGDGRELFYIASDRKLMAAAIKGGASSVKVVFEPGVPEPLFETRLVSLGQALFLYEVTADGKRFLMNLRGEAVSETPITIAV